MIRRALSSPPKISTILIFSVDLLHPFPHVQLLGNACFDLKFGKYFCFIFQERSESEGKRSYLHNTLLLPSSFPPLWMGLIIITNENATKATISEQQPSHRHPKSAASDLIGILWVPYSSEIPVREFASSGISASQRRTLSAAAEIRIDDVSRQV
jgi:hypothetical protein